MIQKNLKFIEDRISAACMRSGRQDDVPEVVAVIKGVDEERVREALELGLKHLGENRLQEAKARRLFLDGCAKRSNQEIVWHMIGHLQSNKVKDAVKFFDLIHSVDSLKLASQINEHAANLPKVQDVLLEVKTSPEADKKGFLPQEVGAAFFELAKFKNLSVRGLMTVAPQVDLPEKARPYFRTLKELALNLFIRPTPAVVHRPILSMGMSDDFEVAVEEGATLLRIGRGIFGERNK